MKRAVVLLSGGLDSATVLALSQAQGFESYALSFRYGQRHEREIAAAQKVASSLGAREHRIAEIDLRVFGGSVLTAPGEIPTGRSVAQMASEIPVTYVPARNTIFLSYALAWAEVLQALDIFIGANAVDYSGYPDCRPEFIQAFEKMADLATRAGVEGNRFTIHAPLIALSKAEIIRQGLSLGVDYSMTHSCYDPKANGLACGVCDSCQLRRKGFSEAGIADPIPYAKRGKVKRLGDEQTNKVRGESPP